MTGTTEIAEMSYEEARDALIQVVNQLEQGGETLEGSLQLWERGEALAARCEEWLLGAKQRLEAARQQAENKQAAGENAEAAAEDFAADAETF